MIGRLPVDKVLLVLILLRITRCCRWCALDRKVVPTRNKCFKVHPMIWHIIEIDIQSLSFNVTVFEPRPQFYSSLDHVSPFILRSSGRRENNLIRSAIPCPGYIPSTSSLVHDPLVQVLLFASHILSSWHGLRCLSSGALFVSTATSTVLRMNFEACAEA